LNILKLKELNNIQISDISELSKRCENYNPYYEEFSVTKETCFFLYYEDTNLVSFLSFISLASATFGENNDRTNAIIGTTFAMESEITAMTLPSKRRQGLFSELFKCALSELNLLGITNIYCAVPLEYQSSSICKGPSHIEYLQKLDIDSSIQFSSSRYTTTAHPSLPTNTDNSPHTSHKPKHLQFTYTPSDESDIPTAYQLIEKRFLKRLKVIGICQLSEESQFTNLWGVEIKKPYRNQGYGLKLMQFVIHDYFKCTSKPLILNVTSKNTSACKLYNHCGFKIVEQIEYFRLA